MARGARSPRSSRGLSLGVTPLVFREQKIAAFVRDVARAHGRSSGRPVRLARFDLGEVIE